MRLCRVTTLCLVALGCSAGVAAAAPSRVPDVLGEDIGKAHAAMSSPSANRRIEGIQAARLLRLFRFEPDLIRLLDAPSKAVRREAVQALETCGTHRAVPPLIAMFAGADSATREFTAHTLRCLTAQMELPVRAASWNEWWRTTTLAEKQTRLFDALSGGGDACVDAARALRALADASAEKRLLTFLNDTPRISAKQRKLLTEALDRVGGKGALPYFLQRAATGDGAAAWALGRRGGAAAEDALLKGLHRNRSLDFLLNLDRLHSTKCGPYVPALCRCFHTVIRAGYGEDLRYPPSPLRRVAANLIKRTGQSRTLVDLILCELEGRPRHGAIPASMKPLFAELRRLLKPEFVREGLSGCDSLLGALHDVADDPALVTRLIPLLQSEILLVRIYAGLTLGRLKAEAAVPALVQVIESGYTFCDATAPASAKHTGAFVTVDGKRQRQSQTVRWLGYLCTALGRIGTDAAREALQRFAVNPEAPRDVRYGSVVGLELLGAPEALPTLQAVARQDIIWLIRDTANRAVEEMRQ